MDRVCFGGLAGGKLEEFLIEKVWMINEAAITRKGRILFCSRGVVVGLNIKTIGRDLVIVNSAKRGKFQTWVPLDRDLHLSQGYARSLLNCLPQEICQTCQRPQLLGERPFLEAYLAR